MIRNPVEVDGLFHIKIEPRGFDMIDVIDEDGETIILDKATGEGETLLPHEATAVAKEEEEFLANFLSNKSLGLGTSE